MDFYDYLRQKVENYFGLKLDYLFDFFREVPKVTNLSFIRKTDYYLFLKLIFDQAKSD